MSIGPKSGKIAYKGTHPDEPGGKYNFKIVAKDRDSGSSNECAYGVTIPPGQNKRKK